jgi:hypothetical protein
VSPAAIGLAPVPSLLNGAVNESVPLAIVLLELVELVKVAKVPRPAIDAAAPSAAMERSSFRPLERVRARGDFRVRMVFLSAWRGSLPSP